MPLIWCWAIALSSVVLPVPLRPTRPYRRPKASVRLASCWDKQIVVIQRPSGSSWQSCSIAKSPVWQGQHGQHSYSVVDLLAEPTRAATSLAEGHVAGTWQTTASQLQRLLPVPVCNTKCNCPPGSKLSRLNAPGWLLAAHCTAALCCPRREPLQRPCGRLPAANCKVLVPPVAESCLIDPARECRRQVAHLNQVLTPIGHTEVLQVQIAAAHGPSVAHHNWCMPTRRLSSSCLQQYGKTDEGSSAVQADTYVVALACMSKRRYQAGRDLTQYAADAVNLLC